MPLELRPLRRVVVTPRPCRVRERTTPVRRASVMHFACTVNVDRSRHTIQRVRLGMEIRRCCVTKPVRFGEEPTGLTLAQRRRTAPSNYGNIYAGARHRSTDRDTNGLGYL